MTSFCASVSFWHSFLFYGFKPKSFFKICRADSREMLSFLASFLEEFPAIPFLSFVRLFCSKRSAAPCTFSSVRAVRFRLFIARSLWLPVSSKRLIALETVWRLTPNNCILRLFSDVDQIARCWPKPIVVKFHVGFVEIHQNLTQNSLKMKKNNFPKRKFSIKFRIEKFFDVTAISCHPVLIS